MRHLVPVSGATWFTSAPAHWPRVTVRLHTESFGSLVATLTETHAFAFALYRSLRSHPCLRLRAVLASRLLSEGLFDVPCDVEDSGRLVPVMVYPVVAEAAAAHFAASDRVLAEHGAERPVYYAPHALPHAGDGNGGPGPLRRLSAADFHPADGPVCVDDLSPTPDDHSHALRRVPASEAIRLFEKIARSACGWAPHLPDGSALPRRDLALTGPEGRRVVLSLSPGSGLQLRFPSDTPSTYRDRLASAFIGWVEAQTGQTLAREAPRARSLARVA